MLLGLRSYSVSVGLIIAIALSLFLSSCVSNKMPAPMGKNSYQIKKTDSRYLVRKGDTLYSIAWAAGKSYKSLAKLNGIASPYVIYPGEFLKLTKYPAKRYQKTSQERRSKSKAFNLSKKGLSLIKKKPFNQGLIKNTSSNYSDSLKLKWEWPIRSNTVKKKGLAILIRGRAKQLVKSSEKGKVVYAGNGLKGYGNLIIIKHNDEFLSAYGLNKSLLVKEGEIVNRGQAIAEVGLGMNGQYMLFFEIRRHGKPILATRYLP